jgi:NAD(P)-dependent dehydrogenase (short-subunit alcohol dehydrogenase family)
MERETEQVAIVTGGGGGIGMAIAARVVAAGGAVVIGDLNDDRGKAVLVSLDAPDRTRFVHVDVSLEGDVEALVAAATDTFGRLDAMFNNAGIGGAFGPIT